MNSPGYKPRPGQLVLLRNAGGTGAGERCMTGWADVALSESGQRQARAAGRALAAAAVRIDAAFVSRLLRARATYLLLRGYLPKGRLPLTESWQLNERHCGSLQGERLPHAGAGLRADRALRWWRGYSERPPQMLTSVPAHPVNDPLYADVDPGRLPSGESLQETRRRVVDYYARAIRPLLEAGRNVLVVSHGDTLRALAMEIEMLTVDEVGELEIPFAEPRLYRFNDEFELLDCATLTLHAGRAVRNRAA